MKKLILFFIVFTSLSAKIFAQNNNGDSLFGAAIVHDVYINFSQPGYWDSLVANSTADVYMKGDVTIDGALKPNCGLKFKGNSSYNNPSKKKSWKIDFNEYDSTQDYNDLKKLNLNNGFKDPSFLREKVALEYCAMAGIPAPRCAYARVYLNGVYWGLYTILEEIDKNFLDDEYYDKKGNLFKGDPSGDLKWYGTSVSSYNTKYELKTNETQNNWSDLIRFIDKLNNSTATQLHDSVNKYFNTASWMKSWAFNNLFVNLDSYLGSGHNYFIYDDSITWRFNFINWDVNEAFGNFNMGLSSTQLKNMSMYYLNNPSNRPLCNKMLGNTSYKAELTTEFCNQVENYFSSAVLDPIIDSLANAIRADVYADTLKSYSNQNFEDNIVMDINLPGGPGVGGSFLGIKPFITSRRTAVVTELAANNCFVGISETNFAESVELFPNPAQQILNINTSAEIGAIQIFSLDGKIVMEVKSPAQKQLNLEHMSAGIYFIKILSTDKRTAVKKFIRE